MKADLHILMLEDEPLDAELNNAQLQLIETGLIFLVFFSKLARSGLVHGFLTKGDFFSVIGTGALFFGQCVDPFHPGRLYQCTRGEQSGFLVGDHVS